MTRPLRYFYRALKSAPVFTAGYVVGGIVVGLLTQAPVVAHAVLHATGRL